MDLILSIYQQIEQFVTTCMIHRVENVSITYEILEICSKIARNPNTCPTNPKTPKYAK